jgi:hypothetical protein
LSWRRLGVGRPAQATGGDVEDEAVDLVGVGLGLGRELLDFLPTIR